MLRSALRFLPPLLLACPLASAGSAGPEGRWETLDDRTGTRRALVRISIRGGRLTGIIERLFARPGEEPEPLCTRCKGDLHDKPVLGMRILRGHARARERWVGGSILDPENGREYRSAVWLEAPDTLRVRGYWGPFYRTQTWRRAQDGGESSSRAGEGQGEARP